MIVSIRSSPVKKQQKKQKGDYSLLRIVTPSTYRQLAAGLNVLNTMHHTTQYYAITTPVFGGGNYPNYLDLSYGLSGGTSTQNPLLSLRYSRIHDDPLFFTIESPISTTKFTLPS